MAILGDARTIRGITTKAPLTTMKMTTNTTFNNSAVETTIITADFGTLTIPANFLQANDILTLNFSGRLSQSGSPNVTFRFKFGGVTFWTGALNAVTFGFNTAFRAKIDLAVVSVGATGELECSGDLLVNGESVVTARGFDGSFDTTVNNTLDFTAQFSVANVLSSCTSEQAYIQVL